MLTFAGSGIEALRRHLRPGIELRKHLAVTLLSCEATRRYPLHQSQIREKLSSGAVKDVTGSRHSYPVELSSVEEGVTILTPKANSNPHADGARRVSAGKYQIPTSRRAWIALVLLKCLWAVEQ